MGGDDSWIDAVSRCFKPRSSCFCHVRPASRKTECMSIRSVRLHDLSFFYFSLALQVRYYASVLG